MTDPELLTSRRNPRVAQFRRARDGEDPQRCVIEGVRALEEAARAGAPIEAVLATERAAEEERGGALLAALARGGAEVRRATEGVLDAVCGARAPQGLAALARRRVAAIGDLWGPPGEAFVVVAAGLADPGNVGTLLRTADAAGATGFATTRDTVSPWNDKALRASAGSVFRLPVAPGAELAELVREARARGVAVAAAASGAGEDYAEASLRPPILLLLGSEGHGLPEEARAASPRLVRIPLRHGVESLNVAAAGAVLCFEIARRAGGAR